MVNNKQEQISAMLDGELDSAELQRVLDHLKGDSELLERWTRYNLISNALHNGLPEYATLSLHRRVADALSDEPVVLAPKARTLRMPPFLKQAAGLAAAASVTAVAILGMQHLNGSRDQAPMTAQIGDSSKTEVASTQRSGAEQGVPADPALDPYLMNHNEYSVSSGMHGVLPYVRLVSHGTDE